MVAPAKNPSNGESAENDTHVVIHLWTNSVDNFKPDPQLGIKLCAKNRCDSEIGLARLAKDDP